MAAEVIDSLANFPFWENASIAPFIDVGAAALDEMLGELLTQLFLVVAPGRGELGEYWLEQGQQAIKRVLVATVWSRREQHQVALGIGGQLTQQLVALLACLACANTGVRLVDDDKLRASTNEVVAMPVRLDVIQADHGEGMGVEDRIAYRQPTLKTGSCLLYTSRCV